VQDHKRAYEGDEGPNTGGMGSYTDTGLSLPFMAEGDYDDAVDVLEAVVDALPDYKGVLYGQFMLTAEGPKVVEFNARFGDPEAMNTLPVLETPFIDVLTAARDGNDLPKLSFTGEATVCKYAVPEGYPTDPDAGAKIAVDEESVGDALSSTPASTSATTGSTPPPLGRSRSSVAATPSRPQRLRPRTRAAAAGDRVRIRHDIGTADLVERRIEHMAEIRK